MNFRDAMSLVSTSVSILSCLEENLVHGCTISSLVRVSVQDENPEVIFVLKKQSLLGGRIKTKNFFTINVLSAPQEWLAKKYSIERLPESISDSSWDIDGKFAELSGCRVIMNCKLLKIYDNHAADIFVGHVVKYSGSQSLPSLIYDARRYGRFQSN